MACCSLVAPGDRIADIGCDHGYLGIYLLQSGKASFVYASDINEGPLQSAVQNADKYGVSDNIAFFLCDGVVSIPRDFDTMICAGMGADTIVSILSSAPWLKADAYRLILQCQSKTHFLRKYLSDNGWHIRRETVVRDGRFLYTVMESIPESGHRLTAAQCYFSPALLQSNAPELPGYYRQVVSRLQQAVDGQKENADPQVVTALEYLINDPAFILLKEESL